MHPAVTMPRLYTTCATMFNSVSIESRFGLEYSEMTPMINHKKQFVYQKTKIIKNINVSADSGAHMICFLIRWVLQRIGV